MKFTLNIPETHSGDADRRWPNYILGRIRTSTVVLIVLFIAVWWVYHTYRPATPTHGGPPSTQVVPPGFVPDPNYTWVPRTRVQEPTETETTTPTTTTPSAPSTTSSPTTTTSRPPFVLPTAPCLLPQPFCAPSTSPTTSSPPLLPLPRPGPVSSSPAPAS